MKLNNFGKVILFFSRRTWTILGQIVAKKEKENRKNRRKERKEKKNSEFPTKKLSKIQIKDYIDMQST